MNWLKDWIFPITTSPPLKTEEKSLDMFLKICEELKVTPDYLLLGNVHANNILCA